MTAASRLATLAFAALSLLLAGCERIQKDRTEDGRQIVTFWTPWAGIERKGLEEVVAGFNDSQDRILVRVLNITDVPTKLMLATAGGNPPDLAIMINQLVASYADNNALTPLDGLAEREGIEAAQFVPTFWDTATYRGRLWALPLTSSVTALHYNKSVFREVGLDPERPPRTLEELERINDLITTRREDGSLERIGHLPLEPGWWRPEWSNWHGQGSYEGGDALLFDGPSWQRAGDWLLSYPQRFGGQELVKLRSGFGRFTSPQNPFFTGKAAMVLQGVWLDNFIQTYAPQDFEYGVAPFPASELSGKPHYAVADVDLLVMPKGARHPKAAVEFMLYMVSQPAMEQLAIAHGKLTSLKDVSAGFRAKHPHPYVQAFIDIANSGHARMRPQLAHYTKYFNDTNVLVNGIVSGLEQPGPGLETHQRLQQKELDAKLRRWARVADSRREEWKEIDARFLSREW